MIEAHRAMISWIGPGDGGRECPPAGPRYSTVARFEDDPSEAQTAWSLLLDFEKNFKDARLLLARVRFLADTAPHDLLHRGSRFELFEGKRRVAKGIILPPSIPVPEEISEFESALIG